MKIVISEFMDEVAVASLRREFEVVYDPAGVDHPEVLHAQLADADALIVRNRTQVRGPLLAAGARLRVVGRLGVGLDNIDLAACQARAIPVIPAAGANAQAVAEYVVCTAMTLLRGAYQSTGAMVACQWPRVALSSGREIAGQCLGLIGFGFIGQRTAQLAQALGMQVIAHDPMLAPDHAVWAQSGVRCASFEDVLAQADVISLHVPLLPGTAGLMSASALARMKPDAILINTSRGGIVDEAAVAAALRASRLGGAALDVFENEPFGPDHPWTDCPRLILTPHVAGLSAQANVRVSTMIATEVSKVLKAKH